MEGEKRASASSAAGIACDRFTRTMYRVAALAASGVLGEQFLNHLAFAVIRHVNGSFFDYESMVGRYSKGVINRGVQVFNRNRVFDCRTRPLVCGLAVNHASLHAPAE